MIPERATYGIYLVIWFKDSEVFTKPSKWDDPEKLLTDLQTKAEEIREHFGNRIEPIIIDVTKKPRVR